MGQGRFHHLLDIGADRRQYLPPDHVQHGLRLYLQHFAIIIREDLMAGMHFRRREYLLLGKERHIMQTPRFGAGGLGCCVNLPDAGGVDYWMV